ncbi:probable tRNA methyltransferase 9B isoform X1 [Alligator mississippiensis]|nr:probable tRNA methyltransferase 9B isoform X1 [Alligator mississippiensis]XP_059572524.1 probable tRNA methyltransferase 9B isoform X1 [Alligator mississippiensis]XP_059572554.1 probable tRNA methyltransferase 9B isoform X1 [Alligator mississippiensis]XP_059572593.1 probable tRNA methyltransferase 9B isoform X1 [Alligator mississippiensis]XP_059572632.1 probable tRNA methyltransferase 9B isoform X1 [Alligator mississippiensis]XP_059572669.1 probable tRNA methyltransferase 9B isoform X1 [All
MEKEASQLEKDHVHHVYEKIAPHFSDARYKAWPKVQKFISNQELGSLIADIGCGNGKYLHINSKVYKLGCDYCFPLVETARNDGHEVMLCHSLCLPYRNECFDAVLSIAVIHHFSTKERRMQAIKEMARILRIGGQIMIYVWAMEQNRRKFEKQDIFVPWNPSPPSCASGNPCSRGIWKLINQKDKKLALNQHSHKSDGPLEAHRKAKSSSYVGEKEIMCTLFEKSLRWSLVSKSLGSALDLSNQWHQGEICTYCTYNFHLSEPDRKKDFEQTRQSSFMKYISNLLPSCRPISEDNAFEVAVEPGPLVSYHSVAFKSCSKLSQDTKQLQVAADITHDCSSVCLPDLVSHNKDPAVTQQLKIDHHPKQATFCRPQNKSKISSSLEGTGREDTISTQNKQQQTSSNGACLRYYHVFKKGELAELIEHQVPELRIIHSYFDHANWCVIAEKTPGGNI